jgi:flagellar basal body-associated protein FliL
MVARAVRPVPPRTGRSSQSSAGSIHAEGSVERRAVMDLIWIIIIVLVVLALLGYFGYSRRGRGL